MIIFLLMETCIVVSVITRTLYFFVHHTDLMHVHTTKTEHSMFRDKYFKFYISVVSILFMHFSKYISKKSYFCETFYIFFVAKKPMDSLFQIINVYALYFPQAASLC